MTLTAIDEKELFKASRLLSQKINECRDGAYGDVPMELYGPFEAPVYKVENKYRMRMVAKCVLNRRARGLFASVQTTFSSANLKGLSLSIDFNPTNL